MKTTCKLLFGIVAMILGSHLSVMADPPEPPPPPSGHGQNGNAPAGAPIDGGLGILLAMGAAYGGKKMWEVRRKTGDPDPS